MGLGMFFRLSEGGGRSVILVMTLRRIRILLMLRAGVGYSSSAVRFILSSVWFGFGWWVGQVGDLEGWVIEPALAINESAPIRRRERSQTEKMRALLSMLRSEKFPILTSYSDQTEQ